MVERVVGRARLGAAAARRGVVSDEAIEQRRVLHDAHVAAQVVAGLGEEAVAVAVAADEVHALGAAQAQHHVHL